jgi:hypothetical protein
VRATRREAFGAVLGLAHAERDRPIRPVALKGRRAVPHAFTSPTETFLRPAGYPSE